LRQWPQALLSAILIPWWLGSEWYVATERYIGAWSIAAQGFLLLAVLYLSTPQKEGGPHFRLGLQWVGCLALMPFLLETIWSAETQYWGWRAYALPPKLAALGYLGAYLPVLASAAALRKTRAVPIFATAAWVFALGLFSRVEVPERSPWVYLWVALGACSLCFWGVRDNRRLFINYGTAIFALDVIAFYFSEVLDKMGRSMGLILLGTIFLGGGWILNRLRSDLIARASALSEGATL
jgi:hypothetical protein